MFTPQLSTLAKVVHRHLVANRKRIRRLDRGSLLKLFEVAFSASLKSEEARPILCTLSVIDPKSSGPDELQRINWSSELRVSPRSDHWSVAPFADRLPLTPATLAKLALAAPPYASTIAVYMTRTGQPFAWGLTDQQLHHESATTFQSGGWYYPPGIIQVAIVGVGSLTILDSDMVLGGLRQGTLLRETFDVIKDGPVSRRLLQYSQRLERSVPWVTGAPRGMATHPGWAAVRLWDEYQSALRRILIGVVRHRHGGALLIQRTRSLAGLHPKYPLEYGAIPKALIRLIAEREASLRALRSISTDLAAGKRQIDSDDYREQTGADEDVMDLERCLIGATTFAASLSSVDGLVLLGPLLDVRAFGVEITIRREPPFVHLVRGSDASFSQVPITAYGTRHRSMFRYCYAHADSLGFVVSQDGDVRAVMRQGGSIVMWDNIQVRRLADPSKVEVLRILASI